MELFSGEPTGSITMRGYVSDYSSPDITEWPRAWAIVKVESERWMATLPLHELIDLLAAPERVVPLGNLPYRWEGRDLVIDFGPVSVRASVEGWRGLARRILRVANSASGLYEIPGARPWRGWTTEVGVLEVEVPGAEIPWGLREATGQAWPLAVAGGFEDWELMQLIGGSWTMALSSEVMVAGESRPKAQVFLWGDPPQLAATILEDGLRIGRARLLWSYEQGHAELKDPVPFDGSMPPKQLEKIVGDLIRRRRRSFSWCGNCGVQLAPERRFSKGLCYGCASHIEGVVY